MAWMSSLRRHGKDSSSRGVGGGGAWDALRGSTATFFANVYHVFAIFTGGEEYEWVGWPERTLRLGFLFTTLILNISNSI